MPVIAWGGMEFTDCRGMPGRFSGGLSIVCTTSSRNSYTWLTGSALCTDYTSIKSVGWGKPLEYNPSLLSSLLTSWWKSLSCTTWLYKLRLFLLVSFGLFPTVQSSHSVKTHVTDRGWREVSAAESPTAPPGDWAHPAALTRNYPFLQLQGIDTLEWPLRILHWCGTIQRHT